MRHGSKFAAQTETNSEFPWARHVYGPNGDSHWGPFSFLYLKKIKISKIGVRFGKFQKYTPVALWGRQGSNVIFFFFKYATKSQEEKKERPCRPPTGDKPLSPTPGATDQWAQPTGTRGAGRPSRGRQGGPVATPPGRPGQPSLYKASPLIPSSFDLKKST